MINYILLVITVACTIFNLWLTLSERQGYDKGLEDGIRMTNEVLEEDQQTDCPCMETVDAVYFCNGTKCERCSPECELTRDPHYAAPPDKVVIIDRCGYCMGASFNDCEECERRRIYED